MKSVNLDKLAELAQSNKGLGRPAQLQRNSLNVARQDVSLPCLCIYQSRLDNNIHWMAEFARQSQVKFAPHGKTTMTPAIFKQQLAAGAFAITVATVAQAQVAVNAGAKRVLMANQLVGRANCQHLADILRSSDVEFFCLIDNIDNIQALDQFFSEQRLHINVLIELGVAGGRCGINTNAQLMTVVNEVQQANALRLAGIEVYEGVLKSQQAVSDFLTNAVEQCKHLLELEVFDTPEVMITAGGSAWYDVVCEAFQPQNLAPGMYAVIRPGCYVTHDQGIYQQAQQDVIERSALACALGSELQSCLEIWAYVQSLPEPGRAIIGMGKRDVAFDAGFPVANLHINQQGVVTPAKQDWHIQKLMDQHAMLLVGDDANLKVGDIIAFGTSHPCLTFDKWRYINLINDEFDVIDVYETCF